MLRPLLCTVACLSLTVAAYAQDPDAGTRAELLAKMREQKARNLQPNKPKGVERALLYMEEHRLRERWTIADGWYPRIGGLGTGGGFAGGAGYRKHFLDDQLFLNASAAISTKGYKELLARASYQNLWRGRLEVGGAFLWRDSTQEDFFGIGPGSLTTERTNFALKSTDVSGFVALTVLPRTRFGVELGFNTPEVGPGTDSRFPTTQEIFNNLTAPGLTVQPDFLYQSLFVLVDRRDQPGNPRSGGLVRASVGLWNDVDFNLYDFRRFDAEVAHFFPIFDKKRVFAVRLGASYTNNAPGNQVPFYFLPYVGGSNTVRGFKEYRFQDENAIFLNAEYRWEAFAGLDMALFYDIGEVSHDWQDADFSHAKNAYGIGFRFNTYRAVFMRLDIATGGGEGTQVFFKFSRAF